ncbi:uncharacterized protein LOC120141087 [Hibiscus syriacus]|uniref:uncharacterized protein LOC120141087 n=1 Tax=Hibiscus syriacus TaxID=106335 RepID=UPI00192123A2|nr:uncharacterized protein LOC120141087 [Hibiscus syriacus]
MTKLQVKPTLAEEIKAKQLLDSSMLPIIEQVEQVSSLEYTLDLDGILCFHGRYCVPKDDEVRQDILQEAYTSPYSMHLGGDKMYKNLKERYFWTAEFAYNNSYKASIHTATYEALYGRRCRTPICWRELHDRKTLGPELVQETEDNVRLICDILRESFDRHKSYTDQ